MKREKKFLPDDASWGDLNRLELMKKPCLNFFLLSFIKFDWVFKKWWENQTKGIPEPPRKKEREKGTKERDQRRGEN